MTTKNEHAEFPQNHSLVQKVGLRISVLREVRQISRSKLALHTKISTKDLRSYELGDKAMTIDELFTIASALHMGAFHFFM